MQTQPSGSLHRRCAHIAYTHTFGVLSTRATVRPTLAAVNAAVRPVGPPPTTTRSNTRSCPSEVSPAPIMSHAVLRVSRLGLAWQPRVQGQRAADFGMTNDAGASVNAEAPSIAVPTRRTAPRSALISQGKRKFPRRRPLLPRRYFRRVPFPWERLPRKSLPDRRPHRRVAVQKSKTMTGRFSGPFTISLNGDRSPGRWPYKTLNGDR